MTEQQLPEGWQMVKFGDIAKHISKRVEPSETDLEIYVGLEHLEPDNLKIKRHGAPGDVEGQKLLVKKGQIIFGKRRAYQRKVAVADWDCICSAHAMVLEGNLEMAIPGFLPFFMQSDIFMNRAVAISEGSLSPTIKWKTLAEQKFLFPSKEMQSTFLKLLMEIDRNLNAIESVLDSHEDLIETVIEKVFLCPEKIKQNSIQIDQLCKERRERVRPDEFEKENIYVGFEHLTSKNYWSVNHSNLDGVVSHKFRFEPDNILYGKIRPYLRKAALTNFKGICSSDLVVLKPKGNKLGIILAALFCSKAFAQVAMHSAKGTKMPRADWNILSKLSIAKLSMLQINQISSVFIAAKDSVEHIQNKKRTLLNMKVSLLSGE